MWTVSPKSPVAGPARAARQGTPLAEEQRAFPEPPVAVEARVRGPSAAATDSAGASVSAERLAKVSAAALEPASVAPPAAAWAVLVVATLAAELAPWVAPAAA